MSDTEIMRAPDFDREEKLTDSQVIPFKDVPESPYPRSFPIGIH